MADATTGVLGQTIASQMSKPLPNDVHLKVKKEKSNDVHVCARCQPKDVRSAFAVVSAQFLSDLYRAECKRRRRQVSVLSAVQSAVQQLNCLTD